MPIPVPCLRFDNRAEEAAKLYTSVFPNSEITDVSRYVPDQPMPEGTVLTVSFTLDGAPFTALNGGPMYSFSEAVSFQISCADQDEVDRYWEALSSSDEPRSETASRFVSKSTSATSCGRACSTRIVGWSGSGKWILARA